MCRQTSSYADTWRPQRGPMHHGSGRSIGNPDDATPACGPATVAHSDPLAQHLHGVAQHRAVMVPQYGTRSLPLGTSRGRPGAQRSLVGRFPWWEGGFRGEPRPASRPGPDMPGTTSGTNGGIVRHGCECFTAPRRPRTPIEFAKAARRTTFASCAGRWHTHQDEDLEQVRQGAPGGATSRLLVMDRSGQR
jgi:hypothetical protein